ncbi:hypothetical protein FRC04_007398 [Tulasnella sp. 424]|nr:hypothetical protein FRC04_007398 [Tulasnella sp. 424]KAG8962690.1 hypothetical protein FRC05_005146 [Tulasnella sp. 425]
MENCPSDRNQVARVDDIAPESGASQAFIDFLPIELLEWVIRLGATYRSDPGPMIEWVREWRRVSRKWASTINGCPSLWSYINTSYRVGNLKNQLARSGTVPLDLDVSHRPSSKRVAKSIRLLARHTHRWRSIVFDEDYEDMIATLGSSPPILETLSISSITIAPDCKLFIPASTRLRKLTLSGVVLPQNFDPPFNLEKLVLDCISEPNGSGGYVSISMRSLHRFLQGSPGLRSFAVVGPCSKSADEEELLPVDLPNLQDVDILQVFHLGASALHVFRAEHCPQVNFSLGWINKRPPLMVWATLVHALKRAKELEIGVRDRSLSIRSKPNIVGLSLWDVVAESGDLKSLTYSILEDILNEAERDSPLSARIELALLTTDQGNGDFNVALEVLKLLQTPIIEPSSGLTRWRLPHLDTLRIPDNGRLYKPFQVFVQERSNRGDSSQAPRAITIIRVDPSQVASEN